MRELDRNPSESLPERCAIVGAGRLGHALAAALRDAGLTVDGPLGRGADPPTRTWSCCSVPDGEIADAAAALTPVDEQLVGHCSGATTLDALGHHEAFSLHPLMTVPDGATRRSRAPDARSPEAHPGRCAPRDARSRARSTCAPSRSPTTTAPPTTPPPRSPPTSSSRSEHQAERLAATAGVPRELLVPLARAALENWAANGAEHALTGPVARGDEATIARQREAIEERAPDLLDTFDALVAASRVVAAT